jgi:hypothetical protein
LDNRVARADRVRAKLLRESNGLSLEQLEERANALLHKWPTSGP